MSNFIPNKFIRITHPVIYHGSLNQLKLCSVNKTVSIKITKDMALGYKIGLRLILLVRSVNEHSLNEKKLFLKFM